MAGDIGEFWGMAYAAVKRVGAQDRVVAWGGDLYFEQDEPGQRRSSSCTQRCYAAGGFAEAKGKYRGSIVETIAVLPIGCCIAENPDNEVRVAGADGSFRLQRYAYVCMHFVCMHRQDKTRGPTQALLRHFSLSGWARESCPDGVWTVLCPLTGHGSRTARQHSVVLLPACIAGGL
jgi:hypothetical protein